MSFNGSLLKLGNYEFPLDYIEAQSYEGSLITQDVDSTATANGVLKRNVVPHQPIRISFNLIDGLTNKQWDIIHSAMVANFEKTTHPAQEKKFKATAYIPEINDYVVQDVYLKPDIAFPIDSIEGDTITYNPINLVFVGY